jgi:Enolase C-terminal domain-like
MAKSIAAGASDYAMLDVMKIGGVTGWLRAMGQGQAASLPISSHIFVEASAHLLAITPTAHWLEYLDIAGAILAEPHRAVDGTVTAKGTGLRLGMGRECDRPFRSKLRLIISTASAWRPDDSRCRLDTGASDGCCCAERPNRTEWRLSCEDYASAVRATTLKG